MLRSVIRWCGSVARGGLSGRLPALFAALLIATSAHAAIWTEEFFGFTRTELKPVELPKTPVWEEYGFEEGEQAVYAKDGVSFTVTAWRLNDSAAAMAVYEWQRPLTYRPSAVAPLAVESDDSLFMASGNYILHFQGRKPTFEELQGLLLVLPMTERSAVPLLPEYLPQDGLIKGSERYVIGPATLAQFQPHIPPSVAAFQYATEAQLGSYQTPSGKLDLAIFSYPTPHIARERLAEFRMLPNIVVKRTGPLLVAAFAPPNSDQAQRLLGMVNYRATITWDQMLPVRDWSMADLLLTAALLIGLLAAFALVAGLAFAGVRMLRARIVAGTPAAEPMVMLHLQDK